jgi:hypothetical protein
MLALYISVPVQNIVWMSSESNVTSNRKLYVDGQHAQFNEGDTKWFLCQVNGSYPKPEVITTLFISIELNHACIILIMLFNG